MGNRPILSGTPTVEVDVQRYEELLHKEERLNVISRIAKTDILPPRVMAAIIGEEEVKDE